jgi:peptidoglycan/xylan/chitin deacetylase (PgdA/CDA1 family)
MKGKKEILAGLLFFSGILQTINKLPLHKKLIVFNYHRIRPDSKEELLRFDEDVFGPCADIFRSQVKWLKANTRVLSEDELLDLIKTKQSPKEIFSMITFDDGYIDNYLSAYPILKEENVPAIFFIPTKTIMERKLGWWDIISYILKMSPLEKIDYEGQVFHIKTHYQEAKKYFLQRFKLEPHEHTKHLIEQLSLVCQVSLPEQALQDAELMTWEQIKEISQNNIAIGSHTHNHHVLATIDKDAQYQEVKISKTIIENQINKKVNSISYPVGNYQHFSKESQYAVKECGYKLAFSFNTGVNDLPLIDYYDIKRIAPPDKKSMFASTAILPRLFTW